MNEEQITILIKNALAKDSIANQYKVAGTGFHTHNGTDSQTIRFNGLSDTPVSYYQQAGKLVAVNTTENALQFIPVGTSGQILTSNGVGALPTYQASPVVPYAGVVNSDGTAGTPFPSGWSSTKNAGGDYTITHNLGTTSYSVVITAISGGDLCKAATISSNTFRVFTFANGGTYTDTKFNFLLVKP